MTVEELQKSNAKLAESEASLREQLCAAQQQIKQLQQQLNWFNRQLFGNRSEKLRYIDNPDQGNLLGDLAESTPQTPAEPTETITYQRRRKQREDAVTDAGLRFDESTPKETIDVSAPELEGDEAHLYEVVSYKLTHRLAQRPGSNVILEYRRPVLKRRDTQQMITTPAPANVLGRSVSDVSFLAGMLVDKFCYHIPLYRQHQRLRQNGIQLSRATLTQQSQRAIALLDPVSLAQFEHALTSENLAMDETPIKAGRQSKGKLHQGYFWPVYGEADEVCFYYSRSRGTKVIKELLGERFAGTLLTDGYKAYERYVAKCEGVKHANCWSHARRKFEQALNDEPQAAREALEQIGALYDIETRLREKGVVGEAKLAVRTRESEPIVRAFWQWCQAQCHRPELRPSDPLSKALKYAMNRVASLQLFLSDPAVPIDTNHLERNIRPIAMGRRNWLFCWTELGAEHVAIIQSLLVTCRLHGVDPYTYLVDVLQRVSQHPASRVIELTPRLWKEHFAAKPLRSDLDRVRQ